MSHISRLTVYPVKSLEGLDRESVTVLEGGTLDADREFALFEVDGDVVNGKRTARVHDIDTSFDPESGQVTVSTDGRESRTFDLRSAGGRDRAAAWFGTIFDVPVTVARNDSRGYVDRRDRGGPSVISTATIETVASWFDGVTVESARRRLRANVEIGGVPAFWEDRFVGPDASAFVAGDVRFEGVTPCARCAVPERDPATGDPTPEFRRRFVENRRETFPDWADEEAFDHFYTTMVVCRVPDPDRGKRLHVGDDVSVVA